MPIPASQPATGHWRLAALLMLFAGFALSPPARANGPAQPACTGTGCAAAAAPVTREISPDTRAGRLAADLYLPPQGVALRGGAVLAHGFLRPRSTLGGHARALAARGVVAVVPSLPYRADPAGNAGALRELAEQLQAGRFAPAVPRFVLVGFSAGALAAVLAAPGLPGLAGLVALDPFDRRSQPGRDSARHVDVPTTVLRAPPAACNGYGSAAPWAGVLPRLDRDILIARATHCDFEAPTTLACRLACFGTDDTRRDLIQQALVTAVERYLPSGGAP